VPGTAKPSLVANKLSAGASAAANAKTPGTKPRLLQAVQGSKTQAVKAMAKEIGDLLSDEEADRETKYQQPQRQPAAAGNKQQRVQQALHEIHDMLSD
jgi:hypothetical protein